MIFNLLLHAFVLLILQCSKPDHLLDMLLEIVYLQFQSVAMKAPFYQLNKEN